MLKSHFVGATFCAVTMPVCVVDIAARKRTRLTEHNRPMLVMMQVERSMLPIQVTALSNKQ